LAYNRDGGMLGIICKAEGRVAGGKVATGRNEDRGEVGNFKRVRRGRGNRAGRKGGESIRECLK